MATFSPLSLAETTLLLQPQLRSAPSAAQRCNSDVLQEVFSYLDRITLANAARVCRGWQPVASSKLYHNLRIHVWPPSARKLADTLEANQDLRGLVRHVTLALIFHGSRWVTSPFDWLALLPEHSLLSVTLQSDIPSSPETEIFRLLDFPAIRTVPRMIVRTEISSREILVKIMNLPHLESLAIPLEYKMDPPRAGLLRPKMQNLAISTRNYGVIVEHILQSFDSPLDGFSYRSHNLEEGELVSLQNGLTNHATTLKYLSFLGQPFSESTFMDDYILSFPSLSTLVCPNPIYTPLLLSRLPVVLSSLILQAPSHKPFADDDFAVALRQHRDELRALSKLVILDNREMRPQYLSLATLCAEQRRSFFVLDRSQFNPFLARNRYFK